MLNWDGTQVDAQEVEVHAQKRGFTDAGNGSSELVGVQVNGLGGGNLVIVAVLAENLRSQLLHDPDDLGNMLRGLHQNVGQGLTDDGVQGNQNQHGDEAPQAAAGHGDTLLLIELLGQLLLLLGVVGVAALDILNLRGQTGHAHHALLGLGVDGGQNGLAPPGRR